jgi:hypothetical protein
MASVRTATTEDKRGERGAEESVILFRNVTQPAYSYSGTHILTFLNKKVTTI